MPGMTLVRASPDWRPCGSNAEVPESAGGAGAARRASGRHARRRCRAKRSRARCRRCCREVDADDAHAAARASSWPIRRARLDAGHVRQRSTSRRRRSARRCCVPSEAVIATGKRTRRDAGRGRRAVPPGRGRAGARGGGQTEMRSGLKAGQKVVVSGQFLIDSEASLRAAVDALAAAGQAPASARHQRRRPRSTRSSGNDASRCRTARSRR